MALKHKPNVRLWLVMVLAVMFWTVGSGFFRDLSANNEETYKGLKLFTDVIELIERNYVEKVDSKDLIQKAIQGMVQGLDPHSQLLTPQAFEELQIDTQGKFTGIGIHITMLDGYVTVVSPIEGTPAYKAGIQARDRIVKVDGETVRELQEAVKMMRGPKGTAVVVTVLREGSPKPIDFQLTRDVIPIESVKFTTLKPGYGYVWVTNFREETTSDLQAALEKLEAAEVPLKGLVLDLRDNGGGLLNQAIAVSDLFLERGEIVSIKGRLNRHTKTYTAHPDGTQRRYPIVLLINGGTASASEIVAGALQDHRRALILGTTSFGKGSVQTVEQLREGYGLKFTIALYYTPSGRSIQAQGIVPDIDLRYHRIDSQPADEQEPRFIKEKDLRNHLEAESPEAPEPEGKESPADKKKPLPRSELRHGSITPESLQADNQVMRALEILISYDIFKGLKS